jgi:enoyl-CoA hydratase/carnithine racemase
VVTVTGGEILLDREGPLAIVRFNRPERLNAFPREMYRKLHEVLGDLEKDETARVAILTGVGRAFSAGEDLKELESDRELSREEVRASLALLQDITRRIAGSRLVYVAAVNGVAAGFGAELAIACDLRLGSRSARFLFPEVRRGLFVTNGVTHLLPRVAGIGRALSLLLTGDEVDARAAEALGLLETVVSEEDVVESAKALARRIAANAPRSVRLTKRALREGAAGNLEDALRREIGYALECFEEGAHLEGAKAFVEKRDPGF